MERNEGMALRAWLSQWTLLFQTGMEVLKSRGPALSCCMINRGHCFVDQAKFQGLSGVEWEGRINGSSHLHLPSNALHRVVNSGLGNNWGGVLLRTEFQEQKELTRNLVTL